MYVKSAGVRSPTIFVVMLRTHRTLQSPHSIFNSFVALTIAPHSGQVYFIELADYHHFSADIKRAYSLLILEWLTYMVHLKEDYPFLFSFAVRTNPFDLEARPEISE